jgi:hypothetical protein
MSVPSPYPSPLAGEGRAGHCDFETQALRSWRTVETAGRYAKAPIIAINSQGFAAHIARRDPDCRGKNAVKVRMQRAAGIGQIPAAIAVMMDIALVGVVVAVLMMVVRSHCVRNRLRAGARRRHDARELGDHEKSDQ